MRCAIYTRVSTDKQSTDMQIDELRRYATNLGWDVVQALTDTASGALRDRTGLTQLLLDASDKRFDVVLVWKLDRLARSLRHLLELTDNFKELGIQLVSLHDPGLDTTTASGNLIYMIMGAVAEFERSLIRERVRAGVAHKRAKNGGRWGHPDQHGGKIGKIRALSLGGASTREIAKQLKIGLGTVYRLMRKEQSPDAAN